MGRTARKYQAAFTRRDARKMERALSKTSLAREHDRLQALRLLAEGYSVEEIAAVLGLSRPTVYRIADRYLTKRSVESVVDQPRRGRPRSAPGVDAERIQEVLEKSPLDAAGQFAGSLISGTSFRLDVRGINVLQSPRGIYQQHPDWG